jgi:hypothetical protein
VSRVSSVRRNLEGKSFQVRQIGASHFSASRTLEGFYKEIPSNSVGECHQNQIITSFSFLRNSSNEIHSEDECCTIPAANGSDDDESTNEGEVSDGDGDDSEIDVNDVSDTEDNFEEGDDDDVDFAAASNEDEVRVEIQYIKLC